MSELIGSWKAKNDIQTRFGFDAFTLPKGSVVSVNRIDGKKALVEVEPGCLGWKSVGFLELFEQLD